MWDCMDRVTLEENSANDLLVSGTKHKNVILAQLDGLISAYGVGLGQSCFCFVWI